jgi:uncharacterized protein (TIGR03435 family)
MTPALRLRLAIASWIALAPIAGVWAQTARAPQAFEVASIKPNRSGAESNVNSLPNGRLSVTNESVRDLIRLAFGVKDYQIARAPRWIDAERYDIEAKTDRPTGRDLEELQALLRQLLADRFQLAAHRETKEGPVYLLVVAKSGPKMTRNDGKGASTRSACGHLAGKRLTMDTVATVLSRHFERDVINRTGLEGKYDFELNWTPDAGPCPASEDAAGAGETGSRPSIFTAIEEQLGLKLEPSKQPVGILVIDHVERPSEN